MVHTLAHNSNIKVVADVREIDEATLALHRPDVILVDIDQNQGIHMMSRSIDVEEFVATARRALPDVRVCALSEHLSVEVMRRCLNAGVNGYLVKDMLPVEFANAIALIGMGESFCDPRIAGRMLRQRKEDRDICDLSPRETQVVRLIVDGMSNKEIGSGLNLSEKTVKNHISRIFGKFNCTARTQVAVHAMRTGLA